MTWGGNANGAAEGRKMMIANNIREQVRTRALAARSEREIGGIIFRTLVANNLKWREVESEDVKQLLVDALHAYRHLRGHSSLRVAV